MISVKNLVFEYPGKRVLHNLSFEIEKGSITVLVGPNGAGKTTLIKCLTGLFAPYSGEVKFYDDDVHDNPLKAHSKMGYLPDFFGLYDDLTVKKCLHYAALAQGANEEEVSEMILKSAKRLKIDNRLDELAGNLSRGLKQRLAIAQAIIHEPELLILDEPASGLDPDARMDLSNLFKQLKTEGMTLIVSSHILAELEDYATDMLIIRDGNIVGGRQSVEEKEIIARKINIKTAWEDENIFSDLENNIHISSILKEQKNVISFMFSGSHEEQGALLKKLVSKDYPIIEFTEGRARLHNAYVSTMQNNNSGVKND